MQDAIISAVYMTMKDTFFTKQNFTELLYQATFALLEKKPRNTRLFVVTPAIIKPKELWTGKQLVTNVIKIVVGLWIRVNWGLGWSLGIWSRFRLVLIVVLGLRLGLELG